MQRRTDVYAADLGFNSQLRGRQSAKHAALSTSRFPTFASFSLEDNEEVLKKREEGSYHQHQNHGALVDVVRVDAGSLPKPAPETRQQEVVFTSQHNDLENKDRPQIWR